MWGSLVFPSACRLRSADSVPAPSGLFATFIATSQQSDFCESCIIGYECKGLPDADRTSLRSTHRSPGSRTKSVCACQVLWSRRTARALALVHPRISPST
jgi:hypothetical protein